MSTKKNAASPRNSLVLAMTLRHGGGVKTMKDRRLPRKGAKNKQAAYLRGDY